MPDGCIEGSFKLAIWVATQRSNKNSMRIDRRQRLDEIGFIWDLRESVWEENFAALMTFKMREGNCLVPQDHIEKGTKLGQWVSLQRSKRRTMLAERRQRLDAIGFVWNTLDSGWEEGFAALAKFKAREVMVASAKLLTIARAMS